MENCDGEDKKKINVKGDKPENLGYSCDQCDFKCDRIAILKLHKKKKHQPDNYCYWRTGNMGTMFDRYANALKDIEDCGELTDQEIEYETEMAKTSRKNAWMKNYGDLTRCNL